MKSTLMFALSSILSSISLAQAPCDLDLVSQTNIRDNDRYFQRDKDRCEGVYLQQVAGTIGDLLVASLTASDGGPTQWPESGALTLRWNQFSTGDVHIQAFPLVPRKHFRLDVLSAPSASYDWRTSLVAKYLAPVEVGVVAWTSSQINGRNQRVYLPIAVGPAGIPKGPYHLTLLPPVDLSEVYLTVASVAPGKRSFRNHTPLKFGSYPANQKIEVDIPPLPESGLYRVAVEGDRKDQGSVATPPLLINHRQ